MKDRFWLVQRLSLCSPFDPSRGFDGFFRLEYMGSAEYEFGTPNESLKRMRSTQLDVYPMSMRGATVYFVASDAWFEDKFQEMDYWLFKGAPSKGLHYFMEHLEDNTEDWMNSTVAWWSLDEDVAWTLDKDLAFVLLDAFRNEKK